MIFAYDKQKIKNIQKHNKQAFTEFYLDSVDVFFRYIRANSSLDSATAKDIVSAFYVKFRDVVLKYNDTYKFETFVWTVFKNLLKDYYKKHSLVPFASFTTQNDEKIHQSFEDNLKDTAPSLQQFLTTKYQTSAISLALETLDGESRDLIHFKFVEEKTYRDIAYILDISLDNVRKKMSRTLKKLENLLQHYH